MAQTGFTPIQLYRTSTAAAAPTAPNLVAGEMAINDLDEKLYFKNSAGTVKLLAASSGASGDVVGPASATDNAVALFDGTTGKLIKNSAVLLPSGAIVGTTDSQTLTNKTLTSPIVSGGTVDNAVIGGVTPAAATVTTLTATSTISDVAGNVRSIPQNAQTGAYVLTAADNGKHISITTGGVTVPTAIFAVGNAVTIFNNSASAQTITQGASTTLYNAGDGTTGNRTLGARGVATVLCVAANTFAITGAGLT